MLSWILLECCLWVFGLGLGGGRCGVGFVFVLAVLGLMFVGASRFVACGFELASSLVWLVLIVL